MDIATEKVDIATKKVDIEQRLPANVSKKTVGHITALCKKYGSQGYFGRIIVEEITGIKSSAASKLIRFMLGRKNH